MEYTRQYQNRINFKNAPNTSTPLNATNLNKIDKALNYIDEKMEEIAEGGGGASALTDLTDTDISNPSNGQVLGYNSTSGKWENKNDNYNNLSNKPQINSVTLSGNKTSSDLGLVSAEAGKGLSTNDYTNADKTKLAGIASGAEVNQNAFSSLKVGSSTIQADSKTDVLELIAGTNVTLTPNTSNDSITISASGGSSIGQYQNVRYAKITGVTGSSNNILATTVVENLASGDSIKVGDIIMLRSTALYIQPSNTGWDVRLYTASSTYLTIGIVDDNSDYINFNIPVDSVIILKLWANSGSVFSATLLGIATNDGYVRSGQKASTTIGSCATAEGSGNTASGNNAHAEGTSNNAQGNYSHAEGMGSHSSGDGSHAEGGGTYTTHAWAHAEGQQTQALNTSAHAEGYATIANGINSHTEGWGSQTGSSARSAHAEGEDTRANGVGSHAGGNSTVAGYDYQTVIGKYNSNQSDTLFEVGNGTSSSAKSNAFAVYSDGKCSWDNGASKFKFTQSGGADGYYDASGTFHAFGSGGSGNTKVKTLYELYASSWSSAPNSDGFYTAQVTLNPTLNPDVVPEILLAGSSASAQPTDTYRTMFSYVERGYMSGSTLTLYAKTKPTNLFKFWVEGVSGSGSLAVACNVIQPNGASGGGFNPTLIATHTILISDITNPLEAYYMDTYGFTAAEANLTYNANHLLYEILWQQSTGAAEVIYTAIIDVNKMKTYNNILGARAYFTPMMDISSFRISQMFFICSSSSVASVNTIVNNEIKTRYGTYKFIHNVYKID